jgi:hypothetical protein
LVIFLKYTIHKIALTIVRIVKIRIIAESCGNPYIGFNHSPKATERQRVSTFTNATPESKYQFGFPLITPRAIIANAGKTRAGSKIKTP